MHTSAEVEIIEMSGVRVHQVKRGTELLGFVGIDSLIGGQSSGGLRMLPDVDAEEVAGLARAMTLKYGFLGLPQGGAKAGVRGEPEAPRAERLERLVAFGEAVRPLLSSRVYVPHADMGTSSADIADMLRAQNLPVWSRMLQDHDSGYYTAVSVALAARQALPLVGVREASFTVAVEGFGKVGRSLAQLLARDGARIVAVSTKKGAIYNPAGLDVDRLAKIGAEWGSQMVDHYTEAERIPKEQLLEIPVDLLSPCARHDSIHAANAASIRCRAVSAGANNPVTPEAIQKLFDREILYVPDFVSNCGGVLGGTMEFAGLRHRRIVTLVNRILGPAIRDILLRAQAAKAVPWNVAASVARVRFEQVKREAEHPGLAGQIMKAGLWAYRRNLLPSLLVSRLSPCYFRRLPVAKR
jgi:glutamate dehydrogenase (NAD(P)+)